MRPRVFINRCRALRDRRGLHEGLYNDLAQAGDPVLLADIEALSDDQIRELSEVYAQRGGTLTVLR